MAATHSWGNIMSSPRPRVSNLTPEELELLALEHVENLFMEFRATGRDVRRQCNPIKLAKDHPWIAAGLAAAAGGVRCSRDFNRCSSVLSSLRVGRSSSFAHCSTLSCRPRRQALAAFT